jgi:hypothetical protein
MNWKKLLEAKNQTIINEGIFKPQQLFFKVKFFTKVLKPSFSQTPVIKEWV